jgi:hypothetical protein
VLVPLDGPGFSRSAIPAAGWLAAHLGAGIYLLARSVRGLDEREAELARGRRPRLLGRSGGRRLRRRGPDGSQGRRASPSMSHEAPVAARTIAWSA